MKLTVDIPEKDYKFIRDTYKETGLAFIPPAIKCECTEAVYNGTPCEERKTGKWINEGQYAPYHGEDAFHCSLCGGNVIEWETQVYGMNPYCKWCGAKMEVEDGEMV